MTLSNNTSYLALLVTATATVLASTSTTSYAFVVRPNINAKKAPTIKKSSTSIFSTAYTYGYSALINGGGHTADAVAQQQATTAPTASNTRRPIIAGNWKLNPKDKNEAIKLLQDIKSSYNSNNNDAADVVIFPPLPYLSDALSILQNTGIQIGAQTASSYEDGAYTGEIAPSMLASTGCSYVLLGHSERRTIFGESDTIINDKMKACLKEDELKVVLCIGETLQEYEAGLLTRVVDTQLRKGLEGVSAQDLLDDRVIIAYEPVWAIGTGLVATPDQAQAAHVAIRQTLSSMYADVPTVASSMRIQYGGSVKPDSVQDLMAMPDVDGALVGGASLSADSFTQIVDGSIPPSPSSSLSSGLESLYLPPPPSPTAPSSSTISGTTASSQEGRSSDIFFSHAPLSHFSVDKLASKGPRKNADIGSPHDSTRPLVTVGNLKAGSWWCAAGGWPSPNLRTSTEIFYVLSGHACVTDMDGTNNYFGPGDVVVLPKEWSGRWDVLEDIHKVWVTVDHPDLLYGIVDTTKAIVKPYSNFAPHNLTPSGVRADATHGSPSTASDTYLDNGHMSTGIWTCTAGSFPVSERATTEAFHLLEGIAFLTNSDGSARRCVAGDTVVLPRGWSGQWDVIEPVKKVWVISSL